MNPKCDECGGTKDSWNRKREEWVCNNRSCPKSPMNSELTYMV